MESGNRIFLDGDASELVFSFAFNDDENTLIKHEARVQFQRTLRVPDDGVEYPLPAGWVRSRYCIRDRRSWIYRRT